LDCPAQPSLTKEKQKNVMYLTTMAALEACGFGRCLKGYAHRKTAS
jgi:hypothetical protein